MLLVACVTSAVIAAPDERAARACASVFGDALSKGNAALLKSILPGRGKVQMRLVRLGPEDGDFSAGQVQAVFDDFLKRGAVKSFQVVHVEYDKSGYALVRGRANLIDRSGRAGTVDLQLALQPEGERWMLRGIRELSR
jgi:hypothetical protein